jgi:hypothetical protein
MCLSFNAVALCVGCTSLVTLVRSVVRLRLGPDDTLSILISAVSFRIRLGFSRGAYLCMRDTPWEVSDSACAAGALPLTALFEALAALPTQHKIALLDIHHKFTQTHGVPLTNKVYGVGVDLLRKPAVAAGCTVVLSLDAHELAQRQLRAKQNQAATQQLGVGYQKPLHFLRDVLNAVTGGCAALAPRLHDTEAGSGSSARVRPHASITNLVAYMSRCVPARYVRFHAALAMLSDSPGTPEPTLARKKRASSTEPLKDPSARALPDRRSRASSVSAHSSDSPRSHAGVHDARTFATFHRLLPATAVSLGLSYADIFGVRMSTTVPVLPKACSAYDVVLLEPATTCSASRVFAYPGAAVLDVCV